MTFLQKFNIPTRNVDFQVDTVAVGTTYNAVYTPSKNTIHVSYMNGETRIGSIPHEQKHRDNQLAGLREYEVSSEQGYRLNMHDEISANIASLIVLREKYLETGDISVFDYYKNDKRYQFYKDAIVRGDINPHSEYKEDFDKEMALIANGTRDMWEKSFANVYEQQFLTSYLMDEMASKMNPKMYPEYHDQNYERAKHIAYTIGGVDFTQYMDRDVEFPEMSQMMMKKMMKKKTDNMIGGWFNSLPAEKQEKMLADPETSAMLEKMFGIKKTESKSDGFLGKFLDKLKNKPVRKVNRNAPEYKKWEDKDGSRVSEVQYKEIPDLTKDVIKKPTKSYSETMQKGHAKIAEMRAKRAAGHEEISSSTKDESLMAARLRELRFENAQRSSGSVTPTRINALQLAQLLDGSVNN